MKISVFTVCMPEYTPAEAAAKLSKLGYDGVEWRVTDPPTPAAPVVSCWQGNRATIDPATIVEQTPHLRQLCRRHKLAMPVLATYLSYKDLGLLERVMEAASVLGVKGVRVGVDRYDGKTRYDKLLARTLKGWEKVVALGDKYKVRPLAEIHMGNIMPSASAARRFAGHFDHTRVGVIYDPGNMIYEGHENWKMGLEILGKYLAHVHVKNASWSIQAANGRGALAWKCSTDSLRRGRVNWGEVIGALRATGYRGWLSLEDFHTTNTNTKLREGIAYLRKLLKRKQN